MEEQTKPDPLSGQATFSVELTTHNIQVASPNRGQRDYPGGFGTAILLFYNGVILGAMAADYARTGQ